MIPLLSIIIPTKNRYTYLESSLRSILATYNNQNVEIIITDNSFPKDDISFITNLFSNLKYFYHDEPISQVENFEIAMEKVSGEYVTMIGDDDGLSEKLIEVVSFMKTNNIDSLNSPFATYYWPDVISKNKVNNFAGKIFFDEYSYEISSLIANNEVEKCLKLGGTSLCNLPRMYYGIIKRDILEMVKAKTGFYFPGPSPDMANAFSSALFVKKSVYFDAPLFIAGNSAKSASGLGLAGKHVGVIKNNPQLPKDCHLQWSMLIPKYWSGPTIWAESVLKVIDKVDRKDLLLKFNYLRLYASCLVFFPEFRKINKTIISKYSQSIHRQGYKTLEIEILVVWLQRFKFLFKKISLNQKTFSEINNIEDASTIMKMYESRIKQMLNYEF